MAWRVSKSLSGVVLVSLIVFSLASCGGSGSTESSSEAGSTASAARSTEASSEGDDALGPGYVAEPVNCPVSLAQTQQIVGRPMEEHPESKPTECAYVNEGGIHNDIELTVNFEEDDGNVIASYREADENLIGETPNCTLVEAAELGDEAYESSCSGEAPGAGMTFKTEDPERTWLVEVRSWTEAPNPPTLSEVKQMLHQLLGAS